MEKSSAKGFALSTAAIKSFSVCLTAGIIITHTDGEKIKAYCRYIDETHAEIGRTPITSANLPSIWRIVGQPMPLPNRLSGNVLFHFTVKR